MATFNIVTKQRRADGFLYVYIRVTHKRVSRVIKTDKMLNEAGFTQG